MLDLASISSLIAALTLGADAPAAGYQLQGRLVDGTAMTRSLMPRELKNPMVLESTPRVPLAQKEFTLHLVAGPEAGKSWKGQTDTDGKFFLTLNASLQTAVPSLVASVEGETALYSGAVAPSTGETEFRLYALLAVTTGASDFLRPRFEVRHALVANVAKMRQDLEVRVSVRIDNATGELFTGRARDGWTGQGPAPREVFRVPIPIGAEVTLNTGPQGGRWVEFPGNDLWKPYVIDAPVLPLLETPEGSIWELHYRIPAAQLMTFVYPVPISIAGFVAWGPLNEKTLAIESPILEGPQKVPNELGVPGLAHFRANVQAGTTIPLALHIDNALLGHVNHKSLFVVLAFLAASAVAALAGLLLGRKEPALDAELEAASGEELIARIALLNARHEEGKISESEWKETRARLVSLARYLVPEIEKNLPGPSEPTSR